MSELKPSLRSTVWMRYCLVVWALTLPCVYAQVTGNITGTVSDETGALIPGVQVTITNVETKLSRTVLTNDNGTYVASFLPVGTYTITAELPGFKPLRRSGIQLTVGQTIMVNLTLSVGEVTEAVDVSADAPLLESQTAQVSQLIDTRQVVELPLNGRTFTQLIQLSAGARPGSGSNLGTGVYAIRANTNFSIAGSRAADNNYVIDGIRNNNLWLNTNVLVPIVDSIKEFRVLQSNYSAEYGRSSGGVIIVQTKSGSNEFHGSAFAFHRNDHLDARNFFDKKKPKFNRTDFGFVVGGPILRDKTFFFVDYQGLRIRQPRTFVSTVPTPLQREAALTGNFGLLGARIFDPSTTRADPNRPGTFIRDPFPGNTIPSTRLSPIARQLIQFYPPPNQPGNINNFVFNPTHRQNTNQFDIRIDQNLGEDRLFVRYSFDDTKTLLPGILPTHAGVPFEVGPFVSAEGDIRAAMNYPLRNQGVAIGETHVLSPAAVNEFRFGLVRWNAEMLPLDLGIPVAERLGMPNVNISLFSSGFPRFNISGLNGLGNGSTFPEVSKITTFEWVDNISWTRGLHTMKAGMDFVRHRFNGFSAFPTRGTFNFNGQFTNSPGVAGTGSSLADFMLGFPSSTTRGFLFGNFGLRSWDLAWYVQDEWRLHTRLTMNLGVRQWIYRHFKDVRNRLANFNPKTQAMDLARRSAEGGEALVNTMADFEPRIGLAFALTSDGKTLLRTGAGITHNVPGQGGGQLYKNPPFFVRDNFQPSVLFPENALSDGLPPPNPHLDVSDPANLSGGVIWWDQHLRAQKTYQWSFGIQRAVTQNLLLDARYVGNRSQGLIGVINMNQPPTGPGPLGPRRPFKLIPKVTDLALRSNVFDSNYHALQTRLEKRYAFGLSFLASWTWGKQVTNATNLNGGGNPVQYAFDRAGNRGPAVEDRRHTLVFSFTEEPPFGKGRYFLKSAGPLSHIVGNWRITGIVNLATGPHFTPGLSPAVSNTGGPDRPNVLRNPNLPPSKRTPQRWFDPGAFERPAPFTFGNAGAGILKGPGLAAVDFGIHRDVLIRENTKLEVRFEFFNLFNRVNFDLPNAVIGTSQAGVISSAGEAREIQLGLKLLF